VAEENDDNEQGGRTAANAAMKRIAEKELREIRKRQRRKRMIVIGLSFSVLFLAIFGSLFTIKSNLDLSRNMVRSPEVRILGYDGALLETIKGHYSQDVSLTTLPERVQNVFVAATDPTFFDHLGVSGADVARMFSTEDAPRLNHHDEGRAQLL